MIKIEHLEKNFDGFQAINGLDLHIKKGSIYGLLGENGSGKTTLIKLLSGIWKPDHGSIELNGKPVYDQVDAKSILGYIPDDLNFFTPYTLRELSHLYSRIYPQWNQERYHHMLSQLNLSETRKLGKFSKGMQKQAVFLLIMCTMPEFLVLDEPVDGLDPIVRKLIWKYIVNDVADREMTVLISSHNLREIEDICDCIGILKHGQMKIERDLDELKSDIHKVQVAFSKPENDPYTGLNVLHRETRGSVDLLIIKNPKETVESVINKYHPLIFDILPLSLEEIFIYELGGEDYELEQILF